MTADFEYLGDVKYGPCNVTAKSTREDWLRSAGTEYVMSRFAIRILNMDDKEVAEFADVLGTTDEERANAIADLGEWFQNWRERYEAGAETIAMTVARLMVIGERLIGRQEWHKQ